ncbi:MAG: type II secretion system protein [Burkholderiales bacterium]|nr:type II secretion system protein [Burkholderiales bacterium]
MKLTLNTRQSGLTMIELAVVVVIFGIFSTVALPHLSHMQRDARIDKLKEARGAMAAGAAITHSVIMSSKNDAQADCVGAPGAVMGVISESGAGKVCTENGNVDMAQRYPTATLSGIVTAAGLVPGQGTPTEAALAHENYVVAQAKGALTVQLTGGPDATQCSFTYAESSKLGTPPVLSRMVTSGC